MSIWNLDKFFAPSTVVVIGGGDTPNGLDNRIRDHLTRAGFSGRIFPVHYRSSRLMGHRTFSLAGKLEGPVDLAVITEPLERVPLIIRSCGEAGIEAALIISEGSPRGESGRAGLTEAISTEAQRAGLRVIGPNSFGIISSRARLNASCATSMPLPGKLAFITQHGDTCRAILDWAESEHIGFSHFVSLGDMTDIDLGDLLDYLGNERDVSSILMHIERLNHVRKFMSAARAVSRLKPIVVLKPGRSRAGAQAALSANGGPYGEDRVHDEAFKRAGIVRVNTIGELFDCAGMMAKQPRPRGSSLAIITNACGPGVMALDELANLGAEPVSLSAETRASLETLAPFLDSSDNPIQTAPDAPVDTFVRAAVTCIEAPETDALLIILTPQTLMDPSAVATGLREALKDRKFPIFTVWMGGSAMERGRRILTEAGIPTYISPERAVRAFWYMFSYDRNLKMLQEIPPKLPAALAFDRQTAARVIDRGEPGRRVLSDTEAQSVLQAYGIPVTGTAAAYSPEEAVAFARDIGFPVTMKKIEQGGAESTATGDVRQVLYDEACLRAAFTEMAVDSPEGLGVLIQPGFTGVDIELAAGIMKDDVFGPVIYFGVGGMMTDLLPDRAIGLPPLNRLLARRIMEGTRIYQYLERNHGRHLPILEEVLIRLSQLATDFTELIELDVNPLILTGQQALAVDVRAVVYPASRPASRGPVISPYPNQYEQRAVTKGGDELFIRPIRPEDASLLEELFQSLSPRTIYLRFCHPVKMLTREMLIRFTQIDYDREVGMVALDARAQSDKIIGVARTVSTPDGRSAEFAVVVADPLQGRGVGACLLETCMTIAKERGIGRLCGYVLPENKVMLALFTKFGWTCSGAGDGLYYYQADLNGTTDASPS